MKQQKKFGLFLACATLIGLCKLPVLAAPPDVDAKGLPAGWAAAPLGTDDTLVDKQSVSVDANGVWTIAAGGSDLWDSNDGGLIVYMKHTGDGHASFRLLSQDKGSNDSTWVKTAAGFRELLAPGSRDVHISYTSDNFIEPAVRVTEDETPKHPGDSDSGGVGFNGGSGDTVPATGRQLGTPPKPIWLGVDRKGDSFGYYYSEDGQIWTSVGNVTIKFPADMLAGIEASKHNNDNTIPNQVSKMDNVVVDNTLLRTQSIANLTLKASSGMVLITWDAPVVQGKDVTFNVYQVNENATDKKKLNTDPIKGGSFTATGLTNGTEYRFAVTAVVDRVESGLQTGFAKEGDDRAIPPVTPG